MYNQSTTLNIDSQMNIENTENIDQYMMIKQNKTRFNDFLKRERIIREKEQAIAMKVKSTKRSPPETLEEIEKDPDLGMKMYDPMSQLKIPS